VSKELVTLINVPMRPNHHQRPMARIKVAH